MPKKLLLKQEYNSLHFDLRFEENYKVTIGINEICLSRSDKISWKIQYPKID